MDPTVVFSEFQVLLFHLWGLKKKMEGRRDMKGEKEVVEQERRKERKKVLKERKNNKKTPITYKKKEERKEKKNQACWL